MKYKYIYLAIVFIFIGFLINSFYIAPSIDIVKGAGPVFSENWVNSMNWIKNNTAECTVIATYWDPGHFIAEVARRATVFDGAHQNDLFTITREGNLTDSEILQLAPTGKYSVQKKEVNGTLYTFVATARIQDIGTSLSTSNETLAYDILKRYNKPGCKEMYFLATADLIGKAHWWTYFASWNPVDKGKASDYLMLGLSQARPVVQQNAIAYTFAFGQQQAFVIYDRNDTLSAYLQQGNQFADIEKLFYFSRNGQPTLIQNQNSQVKGMIWLDPSRQTMVFIPPELEDAIFTRMFFFNGAGLQKFEYVNAWGGEVKLFRIQLS
ncbi:MAG: hypothetical protein NT120_00860 [Candidatus Aenigmarchaeota archaeon]|nr:hypothetical protein [Candidatus Aenigmarchaeota archaeon]